MKSFKIIYNGDLYFKVFNIKEYNCIDENLLNNLYKNKCKIDIVDINKWDKFKKLQNDLNIFILHLINLKYSGYNPSFKILF